MTPEIVTTLAAAAGMFIALGGLIVSLFLWLRSDMHRLRGELRDDIAAVEARLRGEMAAVEARLRGDMAAVEARLRGDIQAVDRKVDDLGERVTQLGERVARVEGKLEFLKDFITRRNDLPPAAAE